MEILQIAKGRLKISLSKEELTEYGTNLECLEAGNASAKQDMAGRKRLDIKYSLKDLQRTLHFLAPNGNSTAPPFFVTIHRSGTIW